MEWDEAITKVANAICKKRGYATTVKQTDVQIMLEAQHLLIEESKKKSGK